ncbi:MAG UNVERIFIED_CONTAM: hypothetical protein LVQ98_07445 [Rickettsiaceae bacterium]
MQGKDSLTTLSLQLIDNEIKSSSDSVYLISYADGKDVFLQNQNAMSQFAINKGIDFIFNYKRKDIDIDFLNANKEIFSEKHGAGMWLWKPHLILKTMQNAKEGAIILYLDSAFYITKPITPLIKTLGDSDVILVHDLNKKNGAFVKGESFILSDCMDEDCRNAPHIWSAILMMRNNKKSRAFVEKWLNKSCDIRILSAQNYGIGPNYPEYVCHHYDQSVLSLVYHKNKSDPDC